MENPWVNYVNRSYSSIKAALNRSLDIAVPEITDKSPSNLMQVIMDMWAGVAELLNYYIDITARELYVGTARRFSSLLKLAELAGYNGEAAVPARTYIEFTSDIPAVQDITIPASTKLSGDNPYTWLLDHPVVIRKGMTVAKGSATQWEYRDDVSLGNTNDFLINGGILLPRGYSEDTLEIIVGVDATWTRVNAFGYYGPSDKVFITKLFTDGLVYLVFGDGIHGQAPPGDTIVKGIYYDTRGQEGNVNEGTVSSFTDGQPIGGYTITLSNPAGANGGRDIQGIDELRKAIPISLRTLDRAVTAKDYEDIATLVPEIRAARSKWNCGPTVQLFVVGQGGGNPTQAVLDRVHAEVTARSMLTIGLSVFPSGESHVKGIVDVTGKYRQKESVIRSQVEQALFDLYDPQSSKINQPVRVSDVISAIDNVPSVDYIDLIDFYVQPFLRPSDPNKVLNYDIQVLSSQANSYATYQLICTVDATTFELRRQGASLGLVTVDTPTTLGDVGVTITSPSNAVNGDSWSFTVGPWKNNVSLEDMSIPVITIGDFQINVNETYIPS